MSKQILSFIFVLGFSLVLSGCPTTKDPYVIARGTIGIAKTTTRIANVGFLAAEHTKNTECTALACLKLNSDKASTAYKECLGSNVTNDASYKECFSKMGKAVTIWEKAYKLANAVYDEAYAAVDLAEALKKAKQDQADLEALCVKLDPTKTDEYKKCIAGGIPKKADWSSILKNGACVVYRALDFFPTEYNKYVLPVKSMLTALADCK